MSPHNQTISLCGNRDGLAIQLSGYKDRLVLAFKKSKGRSTGPGFTCRLKMEEPNSVEKEIVETTAVDNKGFKGKENILSDIYDLHIIPVGPILTSTKFSHICSRRHLCNL